jgi:hypothetical protein
MSTQPREKINVLSRVFDCMGKTGGKINMTNDEIANLPPYIGGFTCKGK